MFKIAKNFDNNDNEMYRIENKYKKKPLIIKFHLIIIVII